MTREEALTFARRWTELWSKKDVAAVAALFAEDVRFTSPKALATVGTPTVVGREALAAYWNAAIAKVGRMRFDLRDIVWDPEARTLVIDYVATIGDHRHHACERMHFDAQGLIGVAEALYGVPAPPESSDAGTGDQATA